MAKNNRIIVNEIPREKLDKLANGVHQGVAASVSPVEYTELSELLRKTKDKPDALIIILDKVEDPHNLGAIIRTSAAANADGIIIPRRNSSQITATVEKSSAGTIENIDIVQVNNLNAVIEELKENNFWVYGAEGSANSYYFEQKFDSKTAIVMGGENHGVSTLVQKNCDVLIKIPMSEKINSLNVSNAASIIIYEIVRQKFLAQKTK